MAPALVEYKDKFDKAVVNPGKYRELDAAIGLIILGKARYDLVAQKMDNGIPWWFIGICHLNEASCNFKQHLANGDPLSARTVNVPKGLPKSGKPPFTWEQGAIAALVHKMHFDAVHDWSIPNCLYLWERYNGFGYRDNHGINSPYLWSYTDLYVKGKYIKDGKYSSEVVSKQPGAAAILKRMKMRGII
jgi:lysozyme family protein